MKIFWPGEIVRPRLTHQTIQVHEFPHAMVWGFYVMEWVRLETWEGKSDRLQHVTEQLHNLRIFIERWYRTDQPNILLWQTPVWVFAWKLDLYPNDLPLRMAYRWVKMEEESSATLYEYREGFRIGASIGPLFVLQNEEGKTVECTGRAWNRTRSISERASPHGVWVCPDYYQKVYEILPGRSFPPVGIRGNREKIPVYQIFWGLPGMYLLNPPE